MSFIIAIKFLVVVAVCDAASLGNIARDVKSDRVILNAGIGVTAPQFRAQQKVDLSRLDVPTGTNFSQPFTFLFPKSCLNFSLGVGTEN
jgi:hypothetical protein